MRIRATGVRFKSSALLTIVSGVMPDSDSDLLHTASNYVHVMGMAIARMRLLHPEDPVLVKACRAAQEAIVRLRELRTRIKNGDVPER